MLQAKSDIHLSKTLSWLLRHGAVREGIQISDEGYINVSDILVHKSLRGKFSLDDIKRVVQSNDKQRFSLKTSDGILQICANQGHSIAHHHVKNLTLIPVLDTEQSDVIHGTYYSNWKHIRKDGLSRMNRNHIHFAIGLPGDIKVTSGMRNTAEVFIYINLKLAIAEGIQFYKSVNNVILSPGNEEGIIKPKYFLKVHCVDGRSLL